MNIKNDHTRLNQGSFMLPPRIRMAESGGRMTNGSASDVANSNGSRMSNGSVSDADTASITLQYAGHSRTVSVPPGYTGSGIQGHG